MLARCILQRDPESRIAYIVFNEKARQEAAARFQGVHVVTSHSLARGRVWPMPLDVKSYPKERLFHWSAHNNSNNRNNHYCYYYYYYYYYYMSPLNRM